MIDLRRMLTEKEDGQRLNQEEKYEALSLLTINTFELLSTFIEDIVDKVDLLDTKIDAIHTMCRELQKPVPVIAVEQNQSKPLNLPPPPPQLVKPAVPKIENLRGKIMDELKAQFLRMQQRQKAEE